jgi:uncharacterized membrane-anchored protein
MLVKLIVGGLLIFMTYNLFRAMMIMLKDDPEQPPMSKFIGRRVMASVVIILIMLLAVALGFIDPNPRPY